MSVQEIIPFWNGEKKARVFWPYARCRSCGLLFCPDYFTTPQLTDLYNQMPDNTAGVPASVLASTHRGYFNILKKYSSLEGVYLEVGADLGFLMECAVKEGRFDKFLVFEPKTEVQNNLRTILEGRRFEIFPDMLKMDVLPEKGISTVVMVHVLDHLLDPTAVLSELRDKMAPGGIIFIVTHDESSFLAKATSTKWGGYSLEHPHVFNPKTISRLLESSGYRVLGIHKTVNYFPLTHLANLFFMVCGLPGLRLPNWRFPSLGLKLGNIATVAQVR